jgi:predicted TIM-barrel fold metal-dependent hydrolase
MDKPPESVIDFHTHAFPDFLAARAVAHLEGMGDTRAFLDGTVAALLTSMDEAAVSRSVVCSIATEPRQFESILKWSQEIASDRITPFPSIHPRSPDAVGEVERIAEAGFAGIKLHPEYQDFHIDEPAMADLYGALEKDGMIVLFHAGFDIGFPDSDRSAPARIDQVRGAFPSLRIVASHLGGFRQWEEAGRHLVGKDIYFDTSYTIGHIDTGLLREILHSHPPERLLFGSDSPWTDQRESLDAIRALSLGEELEKRILSSNARDLLGLS